MWEKVGDTVSHTENMWGKAKRHLISHLKYG